MHRKRGFQMGGFFHTANEQVNYLKSKGLQVKNKEAAQDYFLRNCFCHVMNCYGKFLMREGVEFVENATFDELAFIQIFDKELRYILFKAITEIENSCKALIAYSFQQHYKENNAFLKPENYSDLSLSETAELMAVFTNILKGISKEKNCICDDMTMQSDVFHSLNFKQAIMVYSCMKESDQMLLVKYCSEKLSQGLGSKAVLKPKQLISYLINIQELKESILNGNTLYHFECRKHCAFSKGLHNFYNIKSDDKRKSVYHILLTMRVFLSYNQFALIHNSLRKRMKQLSRLITSIDPCVITDSLGFPRHWHNAPSLPQTDGTFSKNSEKLKHKTFVDDKDTHHTARPKNKQR